jgi:hypothetical protein
MPPSVTFACYPLNNYAVLLAFHGKFDGKDVIALQASCSVVWAGAMRGVRIRADGVSAMARLRWDEPDLALLDERTGSRDAHAALFPLVEFELDILPCGGSQRGLLDGDPEKEAH